MEKIDVSKYSNEAKLLSDIVKKAQESNPELQKLSLKEILANVHVFRTYFDEYLKLRTEGEIVILENPTKTPCGKLEVAAFDSIQNNVKKRSLCREYWGEEKFKLFLYEQIDNLSEENIEPIGDLSVAQMNALGTETLCDERMTAGRIRAISEYLSPEKIQLIQPKKLFEDVLSLNRLNIFRYMNLEGMKSIDLVGLLENVLDSRMLVCLANRVQGQSLHMFGAYREAFMEELKRSGFVNIATLLSFDQIVWFGLGNLIKADVSQERLKAFSTLKDWQVYELSDDILFGEVVVSNEQLRKIAETNNNEQFYNVLTGVMTGVMSGEVFSVELTKALSKFNFGYGLVIEFGRERVKELEGSLKKVEELRWFNNYEDFKLLGLDAVVDKRMTSQMITYFATNPYGKTIVQDKGVEYFMDNFEEVKTEGKKVREDQRAANKEREEEEEKKRKDEEDMAQWENYMDY